MKPDLIVRSQEPLNIEGRAELLMGQETPVEHFLQRSHGPVPDVDLALWRLRLEGLVRAPLALEHAEVVSLPAETRRLLLECAGNGRRFFDPPTPGLAWGRAAVGQARWTGTRLDALLDRAGLTGGAAHVVFHGLGPAQAGKPAFVRSLPVADVRARGVLLAWAMNGETLTPPHGFPLRVVVPGWTGQHWMKWLTRVEVTATETSGYYMRDEVLPRRRDDSRSSRQGAHLVASQRRAPARWCRARRWHRVGGRGGGHTRRGVGRRRRELARRAIGQLRGPRRVAAMGTGLGVSPGVSGPVTVLSRATDDRGRTQPERGEWNPLGYLWDGWDRITVALP